MLRGISTSVGIFSPNGLRSLICCRIASASIEYGWRAPAVKWVMVQAVFTGGVSFYVFYALQPFLLELYGDPEAYQIAGSVAAIVAGAQIIGGFAAPVVRRLFHRRTSALIVAIGLGVAVLAVIGIVEDFWFALGMIVIWGLLFAAATPIRQTYLNGLIPSEQRATVLSFDSMIGSTGGVVTHPARGTSFRFRATLRPPSPSWATPAAAFSTSSRKRSSDRRT